VENISRIKARRVGAIIRTHHTTLLYRAHYMPSIAYILYVFLETYILSFEQ